MTPSAVAAIDLHLERHRVAYHRSGGTFETALKLAEAVAADAAIPSAPPSQRPATSAAPGFLASAQYAAVGPVNPWRSSPLPADWGAALPDRAQPWLDDIEAAAGRVGLDPRLLAALVWSESEFTPDAESHVGAIGLTQLMPATAEGLGVDPHDPLQNLDGGARYLASMIRRFGSTELGLAAYNAGPGRVSAARGIPPIPETQAYVATVLTRYRTLGGA